MKKFNPTIQATAIKIIDLEAEILDHIITEIKDADSRHLYDDEYEAYFEFLLGIGSQEMTVSGRRVDEFQHIPESREYQADAKLVDRNLYDLDISFWNADGSEEIEFTYQTESKTMDKNDFAEAVEDGVCKV